MRDILATYIFIINLAAFTVFGYDKRISKASCARRIPEKTLFLLSALGGACGMLVGMALFRHKTKHPRFLIGIPVLFALWFVICIFIVEKIG